ncbi:MAG: hypothetical protein DRJ40_06720 [Thermoprotei archaeon]|nr:MAG: hypothetical protein DRJ40_06720 [Thermoprotei archaeon]
MVLGTWVYWDLVKNVPLILKPVDEHCEAKFVDSDVRPLFIPEVNRLKQLLAQEFGESAPSKIVRSDVLLCSQVKNYVDDMKMIIAEGDTLCYMFFDVRTMSWRVRLGPLGASRAIQSDLVSWCVLPWRWFRRGVFSRSDFEEFHDRGTDQVVILSRDRKIIGLGVCVKDKVIVIKKWRPRDISDTRELPRSTWYDVLRSNEDNLYTLRSKVLRFIHTIVIGNRGRAMYVTFSGGKDSTVLLSLLLEYGIDAKILFNDTKLEHPETYGVLEHYMKKLGCEIEVIKSDIDFMSEVMRRGPPARDYRWCTRYLKVRPTIRYWKRVSRPILCFTGLRKLESLSRAKLKKVFKQYEEPNVVYVAPLLDWNSLMEWLFILWRSLPYIPLYLLGYERIGCFMCPSCTLAEHRIVKVLHPDLWSTWEDVLRNFAQKHNLPSEWVTYELWRWLGDAPKKRILCRLIRRDDLAREYSYAVEYREEPLV